MAQKKLSVKLCVGTTCYIMGGSELLMEMENLPGDLKENVQWEGCPCLELCRDPLSTQKPPYLYINNVLYSGLSPQELVKTIRETLNDT